MCTGTTIVCTHQMCVYLLISATPARCCERWEKEVNFAVLYNSCSSHGRRFYDWPIVVLEYENKYYRDNSTSVIIYHMKFNCKQNI